MRGSFRLRQPDDNRFGFLKGSSFRDAPSGLVESGGDAKFDWARLAILIDINAQLRIIDQRDFLPTATAYSSAFKYSMDISDPFPAAVAKAKVP